jgi:acyl-CoA thioester hydrolase
MMLMSQTHTITPELIAGLPLCLQFLVPNDYIDDTGRMNPRFYLWLFDDAAISFFDDLGMTPAYLRNSNLRGIALEQHLRYWSEVNAGDTISIRARLLGRTEKRMHYMLFMTNDSLNTIAATLEVLASNADLNSRKTAPFPTLIAERIAETLDAHDRLEWDAPVCGVIRP